MVLRRFSNLAVILYVAVAAPGCREAPAPAPAPPPDAARIDDALESAGTYLDAGKIGEALAITSRLVDRVPDDPRGHELHALVLIAASAEHRLAGDFEAARRDLERASAAYERAIDLAPPSAGLHQSAGETAQAVGRPEDALRHYESAKALAPGDPKHHLYAGLALIQLERLDEADAALAEATALDPDLAVAHASRATVAARQRRDADALVHVREARAIDAADPSYRLQEAMVLRRLGDPRAGLELLVGLPEPQLAQEAFAAEIAACALELDRPAAAAAAWERCLAADPGAPRAWRAALAAAEAHADADDLARARELLDLVEGIAGADAEGARRIETLRAKVGR
jgi:tetratricopeptide (TPR) repeat protein